MFGLKIIKQVIGIFYGHDITYTVNKTMKRVLIHAVIGTKNKM
jgi:hypothetical protein